MSTNDLTYKTEIDTDQKTNLQLPKVGGGKFRVWDKQVHSTIYKQINNRTYYITQEIIFNML